jgi:hypothetical protein
MAMQGREPFAGVTPRPLLAQILGAADFASWGSAWIAGSGTFSIERALGAALPELPIYGNDVSLLSAIVASLVHNEPIGFTFVNALERWETLLEGRPYIDRCAAVVLCTVLDAQYRGASRHSAKHWAYYERDLETSLTIPRARLVAMASELRLAGYRSTDFREQLEACAAAKGGMIVALPLVKGLHENSQKYINANVRWDAPKFDSWHPAQLPALLDQMDLIGVPWVALSAVEAEGRAPAGRFRKGLGSPTFIYSSTPAPRTSLVDLAPTTDAKPFKFIPVDIDRISKRTQVRLYPCKAGSADYVKGLFLQENIVFVRGMVNILVYLDDMLAGVLTYNRADYGMAHWKSQDCVYLLSDVSTNRFGRISKLLPMLATSKQVLQFVGDRLTHRPVLQVLTTVRTNNVVSMKYRGIWNLIARKEPGKADQGGSRYIINYGSDPRDQTPQQIYKEWLRLYFKDDRDRKVTNSYARPATD